MKHLFKYIAIAILTTVAFSCQEDDNIDFVSNLVTEPVIASEDALIAIDGENLGATAYTLIWEKANFGEVPTPVFYEVQAGLPGASDSEYEVIAETSKVFTEITGETLNNTALLLGLEPDMEAQLNLRVLSFLGARTNTKVSAQDVTLSIIPFDSGVEVLPPPVEGQPQLFLVGAVQAYYGVNAWTPEEALPMAYIGDGTTQLFEAYVKIGADDGIKFISAAAPWADLEGNYGLETAGENNGQITNDGGSSDIRAGVEGFYYVRVDIDTLTFELVQMDWGIIGDSTPLGWDGETSLNYNFEDNSFELNQNLVDGQLKFRSSNTGQALGGGDWDFNVGTADDSTAKDTGDDNFQITGGNFDIVLSIGLRGSTTVSGL